MKKSPIGTTVILFDPPLSAKHPEQEYVIIECPPEFADINMPQDTWFDAGDGAFFSRLPHEYFVRGITKRNSSNNVPRGSMDLTIDEVLRFLVKHNVKKVEVNHEKDEAFITERYGAVTKWQDLSALLQPE